MKYLGINLSNYVQDSYAENYKIVKTFKKTEINGEILCSMEGRVNI